MKRTATALLAIGVLALGLAGCSASNEGQPTKPLPPTVSAVEPGEQLTGGDKKPAEFVSSTEVDSAGMTRTPELEANFLDRTGIADSAATTAAGKPTAVREIVLGGGAVPTPEYTLNVAYQTCNEVVAGGWDKENGGDPEAIPNAMDTLIKKMGFNIADKDFDDVELVGGWTQVIIDGWEQICLPSLDERVRQEGYAG